MTEYPDGYASFNFSKFGNLIVPVGHSVGEKIAWLALELNVTEETLMANIRGSVRERKNELEGNYESAAPQRSAPAQGGSGQSSGGGTGAFCPQAHSIELMLTKPEWREVEYGPNGEELQQKFFCGSRDHPGHEGSRSVWRSQAFFPHIPEQFLPDNPPVGAPANGGPPGEDPPEPEELPF